MKRKLYFSGYLIFFISSIISCGQKENSNQQLQKDLKTEIQETFVSESISSEKQNALPVIDVTKKYPEKEIYIQDIAEVTYIPLETRDSFPFHGSIEAVHDNKIIARNFQGGDIFVFSTDGKIERVINKLGNGPKEYSEVHGLAYDDQAGELFISNIRRHRMTVFDIEGNFKRSFNHIHNKTYHELINFNNELIICDDTERNETHTFFTISKTNGELVKNIGHNFEEKISPRVYEELGEHTVRVMVFGYNRTTYSKDGLIINDLSSDTTFIYNYEGELVPFLTRIPLVHSMTPPVVLITSCVTDRYIFLNKIKKEFHYNEKDNPDAGISIDQEDILYDKEENKIYTLKIFNKDYSIKRGVDISNGFSIGESVQLIPAYNLVESYNNGELKGQLKEIASQLDINDNPVLMFIKFKEY